MHEYCLERLIGWLQELIWFDKVHKEEVVGGGIASYDDALDIWLCDHLVAPKLLENQFFLNHKSSTHSCIARHLPNALDIIEYKQRFICCSQNSSEADLLYSKIRLVIAFSVLKLPITCDLVTDNLIWGDYE